MVQMKRNWFISTLLMGMKSALILEKHLAVSQVHVLHELNITLVGVHLRNQILGLTKTCSWTFVAALYK